MGQKCHSRRRLAALNTAAKCCFGLRSHPPREGASEQAHKPMEPRQLQTATPRLQFQAAAGESQRHAAYLNAPGGCVAFARGSLLQAMVATAAAAAPPRRRGCGGAAPGVFDGAQRVALQVARSAEHVHVGVHHAHPVIVDHLGQLVEEAAADHVHVQPRDARALPLVDPVWAPPPLAEDLLGPVLAMCHPLHASVQLYELPACGGVDEERTDDAVELADGPSGGALEHGGEAVALRDEHGAQAPRPRVHPGDEVRPLAPLVVLAALPDTLPDVAVRDGPPPPRPPAAGELPGEVLVLVVPAAHRPQVRVDARDHADDGSPAHDVLVVLPQHSPGPRRVGVRLGEVDVVDLGEIPLREVVPEACRAVPPDAERDARPPQLAPPRHVELNTPACFDTGAPPLALIERCDAAKEGVIVGHVVSWECAAASPVNPPVDFLPKRVHDPSRHLEILETCAAGADHAGADGPCPHLATPGCAVLDAHAACRLGTRALALAQGRDSVVEGVVAVRIVVRTRAAASPPRTAVHQAPRWTPRR
mmetsp:Transcript_127704/g.361432  ORF Transcript_127704/g.361432 Transcript_127704/m.361432 type:complete len:534 (+) Transcript_127704:1-1602(+)